MRARLSANLLPLALLLAAPLGAQAAPTTPLDAAVAEAIAQRAFERFKPKGMAVAIVQNGELLLELGLGERAAGKPVTPNTLFNIASCSKAFTAALMAQLVTEGKLRWDDRVVERLPEFRMADPWLTANMTLADLLSHRCGLATFAGDLLWYGTERTDADVLARLARLPITQRFREQFGYQNLMYMVAGLVMERQTGLAFDELVEQRLLVPLGMHDSRGCAQRLGPDAERATPHIDGQAVPDHVFHACKPAASIYASVHDLSVWVRMLVAGGKLNEQQFLATRALAELWRPHVAMGGGSGADTADLRGYGLGWFLSLVHGKKLVEHDGGMPGFLSKVSLLPVDKFGFVVLNNANDGTLNEALKRALLAAHHGGDGIAEVDRVAQAAERMRGQAATAVRKREAARVEGTQPSLPLAAYAGSYEDATFGEAKVTLDGEQLHFAIVPAKARMSGAMSHWHRDVFRVDFPDRFLPFALVRFEFDHDGKITGLRIDCPIVDFDFAMLEYRRR